MASFLAGFELSGPSGQGFFFDQETLDQYCCRGCRRVVRRYRPKFITLKEYFDFCYTYDGRAIVSDRFRRFCVRHKVPGCAFARVGKRRRLYWFRAVRRIPYPRDKRSIWHEPACRTCGYRMSYLIRPVRLSNRRRPLARGFWRTDLEFGHTVVAHQRIFVDVKTAEMLRRAKLSGLSMLPFAGGKQETLRRTPRRPARRQSSDSA
jgi:hypothetical protein